MKAFQSLIPTLGIFALARAGYYANVSSAVVSYTTITTDIYTTFCPSPTKITQGSKTYTVTEATTLTITDCPCTVIKPVVTIPLSSNSYVNPPPEGYTTITTDILTTFCPSPTMITQGSKTYTVTEATTLTITDCPCTVIKPVVTIPLSSNNYVNPPPEGYTTITTDILTTFCPSPTKIIQGSKTYTVTEATTLTITECPCTVVKPIVTIPVSRPDYMNLPSENATVHIWATATVSTYVTVCPTPTTFTAGSQTYTVSESTLLTITNCPCTISYPATPITTTAPTTVSVISTYCSSPTTIIVAGTTYTASTPGYVSIPVVSTTTYVVPAPVPTTPITLSPLSTPGTYYTAPVVVPSPTNAEISGPAQVTSNAAGNLRTGIGAIVVGGLAALLL